MEEYLDKNGLHYKYQTGVRVNISTDSCLLQLQFLGFQFKRNGKRISHWYDPF